MVTPAFTFWRAPLARLLLITAVAGAIGWAFTPAWGWAVATVGVGALTFLQLYYLFRLARWLEDPGTAEIPEGWGAWQTVFAILYKAHRQRERDRKRLTATVLRFRQAAEAMPDGIVVLSNDERIEWCNPQAADLLGLDAKRDHGLMIGHLIRQPGFVEYLRAPDYGDPLLLRSTQRPGCVLSVQIVPFDDTSLLMLIRDVTQLERVEAMRRDFIANVSHELRTPLTVVGGFLETMIDSEGLDPAAVKRYQQMMFDQTTRMRRLVEDLLTLSRLEAADHRPREDEVNVPAMVEAIANEARSLSNGRHEIVVHCGPLRLRGSEDELRSAFSNLATNAIRYTPAGGRVTIEWTEVDGAPVYRVTDTGVGIAAEHIPRLTERFYRVDRSRSRETGGTGLGLAIVKHVVTRHQGRLQINSEPGRGSTFSVDFPAIRVLGPEGEGDEAKAA